MLPIFSRIKTWWDTADRNQRVVTLGGIGTLFLLLLGTAFFATRPHLETAAEGLSTLELAQDLDILNQAGITAQAGDHNSILVPAGKTKEAQMKLALAGKLPEGSAHLTFPELKEINPMTSPDVAAQMMLDIKQRQIQGAIETLEGVSKATVLITSPKETVFANDDSHPTASVTITENGAGGLTPENGRVIANLICTSVDKMRLADVFVSSSTLGVLWDGQRQNDGYGGDKAQLDAKAAREWELKVMNALSAMGPDNFRVAVRANVDTVRRHVESSDVTTTDNPTAIETRKESMQGGAKRGAVGIAGSSTNIGAGQSTPASPSAVETNGGSYTANEKRAEYGQGTRKVVEDGGTGDLKELAITVVANSDKVQDVASVQKIVESLLGGKIVRDASGVPLPNQAFSALVSSVKFDAGAAIAAKAAADAAAGQQRMQTLMSLLPIATILAVALLVARQVGKISKAVLPPPPAPEPVMAAAFDNGPDGLPGMSAGMESLPMSFSFDEGDDEPVETIEERINRSLESLKNVASERPEMMANMITSMLLGERA